MEEGASHCKAQGHSAVICAKVAEPIEILFGLWTRVGPRKHVLDGAQIPMRRGNNIRGKDVPGHARRHSAASCAKMAEPIDLQFGLWTRVDRTRHTLNRIRQVAPMCPNTIELSVCGCNAALR